MVLLTRLLAATFTTSLLQELLCNELLSIMCFPQLMLRIHIVLYCKLCVVENELFLLQQRYIVFEYVIFVIGLLNIISKVIKFSSQLHAYVLYLIV